MKRTASTFLVTSLVTFSLCPSSEAAFTITYQWPGFSAPPNTPSVEGSDASEIQAGNMEANGDPAGANVNQNFQGYVGQVEAAFMGTTEADALADTEFLEFNVTLANPATERMNLSSISYTFGGTNDNQFSAYDVSIFGQSSVGGFGMGNPVLFQASRNIPANVSSGLRTSTQVFDLTGPEFQNLSEITFQFRFAGTGTNTQQEGYLTQAILSGETATIPEPSAAIFLVAGLLGLFQRRR